MPFGPIFRWETAAIARRERDYVIRFIYGLVILVCFAFPLLVESGLSSAEVLEHRKLVAASMASFAAIVSGQALALFLVTPALFGGAIAQEVERGNLVLLLASPLRSLEVVLGKLGPRMAQVALMLAVAIPVLALLSLNGGVDEKLVMLSNAVLLTTAFLIASLAILISALSASVRQAVIWTYVLEFIWLAAPSLIEDFSAVGRPAVREWAILIGGLVGMTTPVSVLWEMSTLPPSIVRDFVTTMLVQLGLGALLLGAAAAVLRPLAKGTGPFGWRLRPVTFLLSRRRLLPRPRCGDRAVLWKEMHAAHSRVLTRIFVTLIALAFLIPLGWTTWKLAAPAFGELTAAGYTAANPTSAREEFNVFLRFTLIMIYVISLIGLAVFCGTSMTHEKERDTWTSLIGTPLDAQEIVGQKILGACWRLRWPGVVYLLLLALGVASGAIHPLGGILNFVQLAAFVASAACLATYFSLRSKSSIRALSWTFFWLFLLNGGYLMGCFLIRNPHLAVVCLVTPAALGFSLASYPEVDSFLKHSGSPGGANDILSLLVLNLICYGSLPFIMWFSSVTEFAKVAGRPNRGDVAARIAQSRRVQHRVGKPLSKEH